MVQRMQEQGRQGQAPRPAGPEEKTARVGRLMTMTSFSLAALHLAAAARGRLRPFQRMGPAAGSGQRTMRSILSTGALLLALAAATVQAQPAPGAELAGVKYAPGVTVADLPLQLNGAGIRFRFVVQVYTAGLYLSTRADTAEAVLATPGPKRLHVVMLRDIDASELGRLFTRGMQDNAAKEEFSKSIEGTIKMADIFSAKKRLSKGESFSVDYLPGVGTQVLVNGKPAGELITEPEFFRALMGIWLGPNPADAGLKQALLGRAPVSANPRQR